MIRGCEHPSVIRERAPSWDGCGGWDVVFVDFGCWALGVGCGLWDVDCGLWGGLK